MRGSSSRRCRCRAVVTYARVCGVVTTGNAYYCYSLSFFEEVDDGLKARLEALVRASARRAPTELLSCSTCKRLLVASTSTTFHCPCGQVSPPGLSQTTTSDPRARGGEVRLTHDAVNLAAWPKAGVARRWQAGGTHPTVCTQVRVLRISVAVPVRLPRHLDADVPRLVVRGDGHAA